MVKRIGHSRYRSTNEHNVIYYKINSCFILNENVVSKTLRLPFEADPGGRHRSGKVLPDSSIHREEGEDEPRHNHRSGVRDQVCAGGRQNHQASNLGHCNK
jgi:hypothetical protein